MTMAGELDSCKLLSGLLSGLAQKDFHGHPGITEELLRSQLYPEVPPEEFRPFLAKMRGILKVPFFPAASVSEPRPLPASLGLFPQKLKGCSPWALLLGLCIMLLQKRGARSLVSSHFLRGDPFLLKLPAPPAVTTRHPRERALGVSVDTNLLLCRLTISSCLGESAG